MNWYELVNSARMTSQHSKPGSRYEAALCAQHLLKCLPWMSRAFAQDFGQAGIGSENQFGCLSR